MKRGNFDPTSRLPSISPAEEAARQHLASPFHFGNMADEPQSPSHDSLQSARAELLKAAELIRGLKLEKERMSEQLRALQRAVRSEWIRVLGSLTGGIALIEMFSHRFSQSSPRDYRLASHKDWCVEAPIFHHRAWEVPRAHPHRPLPCPQASEAQEALEESRGEYERAKNRGDELARHLQCLGGGDLRSTCGIRHCLARTDRRRSLAHSVSCAAKPHLLVEARGCFLTGRPSAPSRLREKTRPSSRSKQSSRGTFAGFYSGD